MLSPRLRAVAKYIVDHTSDFGLDTIRESARKCGVSTYAFVRLAKHLGFASFEDLRQPFRHALVATSSVEDAQEWIDRLRGEGENGRVLAEASLNTLAIVRRSLERQSADQFARVTDLLLTAPRVYVTAARASFSMAYYFDYVGRMALPSLTLIPRHQNSAIDELNTARLDDVLLVFTSAPYSREIIDACKFAQSKGMKLVLISDSDVISPEFHPDETFVATTISTHHFGCYTGIVAITESLLALLVHRGGVQAAERIKSYETLRRSHDAYWATPKKH